MPITLADLHDFHAAYPTKHWQIQLVPPGQAGAAPMLGFIADGDFCTTEEVQAYDIAPLDAVRLWARNYEDTVVDDAAGLTDLDAAWLLLNNFINMPGLDCPDGLNAFVPRSNWRTVPLAERRSAIMQWLDREARNMPDPEKSKYGRQT
ncbi:hypothetical protein [Cupriavidus necator]